MPARNNKKTPAKQPDPALIPFLNDLAAMIAAKLLAEHRKRQGTQHG